MYLRLGMGLWAGFRKRLQNSISCKYFVQPSLSILLYFLEYKSVALYQLKKLNVVINGPETREELNYSRFVLSMNFKFLEKEFDKRSREP